MVNFTINEQKAGDKFQVSGFYSIQMIFAIIPFIQIWLKIARCPENSHGFLQVALYRGIGAYF